ncbi:putative nonribosomal peptide synthase [Poronia punctata]|nr:putative nonribosomal peptide synthase [Poronia punctata]
MPVPTLDTSVVDLVDHWSAKTPDAVAAEWQGQTLTYAQLRDASLHVAHALLSEGSGPGAKIPVLTQMSLEMLPAIVGVLRTGACYVPMDVMAWSKDRIEAAVSTVAPPVAFATTSVDSLELPKTVQFRPEFLTTPFDCTEDFALRLDKIRNGLGPDSLAYVIFTSGTTGKPKGVMVSHFSIHNLVSLTEGDVMKPTPGKRLLLTFSIGFDGCAGIVWSTLTHGGTLVMASSSDFPERATTCQILILTPSMLASLDPSLGYEGVEDIFLGGEAPSMSVVRQWITPTRHVYNAYGPSEATVAVTVARMDPHEEPTLGNVIPGVTLVLVDEDMKEAEVGEILIAGPCLAAGYINNPEMTAKKFIQWNGRRYYRTGDRARRTERGLEWAGRVDRLVKNRGFLVNLESEVEPAILRFEAVRAATAFIWRGRLIGCVQPAEVDVEALRAFMKENFDHFIVPDEVLAMSHFPLTANSKVDWNALRAQLDDRLVSSATPVPGEELSALDVARMGFAQILLVSPNDLDENSSFTKLGGNSLAAIKLSQFLRKHGYSISIGQILKADTLGLIQDEAVPDAPLAESNQSLPAPLTDMQKTMLVESQSDTAENCIIFKMKYVGSPVPTPSELGKAWEKVLSHHSIFRMVYDLDNWTQTDSAEIHLDTQEVVVVESQYESAIEAQIKALWRDVEVNNPLRLDVPYSSMTFVSVPERKALTMLWRVHHILIDGFSLDLLTQDLKKVLAGESLSPSPRYQDFALFFQKYRQENAERVEKHLGRILEPVKVASPLEIPRPFTAPEPGSLLFHTEIASAETKKDVLNAAAHNYGVSSSTLVSAAWALVLRQLTASDAATWRVSGSGRMLPWAAAASLVGSMHTRALMSTVVSNDASISEWLQEMHNRLSEVSELQSLTSSIPVDAPENTGVYFNFLVQSFLGISSSKDDWDATDLQKPSSQLVWLVYEDGDDVYVAIQLAPRATDISWARKVNQMGAYALRALVTAKSSCRIGDLQF